MQSVTLPLMGLRPLCLDGNTRHQGNAAIEPESLRRTAFALGILKRGSDSGSDRAPRAQAVCAYVGEAAYIPVPLQTDFTAGRVFVLDNLNVHCSVTLKDPTARFHRRFKKIFAKWPNGITPTATSRRHDQPHGGKLKTAANTG
jgi:hypothetical protein